jgi:hypothetical protein
MRFPPAIFIRFVFGHFLLIKSSRSEQLCKMFTVFGVAIQLVLERGRDNIKSRTFPQIVLLLIIIMVNYFDNFLSFKYYHTGNKSSDYVTIQADY